MRARTISLSIVAVVALLGLLSIVVPRIKGEARPSSLIPFSSAADSAVEQDPAVAKYCTMMDENRTRIADIVGSGDPAALVNNLSFFQSLASSAPPDLTASWSALNSAIASLKEAIVATGHQPDDFAGGQTPKNLTAQQRAAVRAAAGTLTSAETLGAANAIEQEVRDVCKIDLGM